MAQAQPQFRRKRARLVCVLCHDRKLKCDLETQIESRSESCTNCIESGSLCRQRPSKRRKRRANGDDNTSHTLLPQSIAYPNIQPATRILDPPASEPSQSSLQGDPATQITSHHNQNSTFSSSISQSRSGVPLPLSASPSFQTNTPSNIDTVSLSNLPTASSGAGVSYVGDSGFLSIFEQEHRTIAASDEVVDAQTIVVGFELPPVELQQSFAETYFDWCWPWCPVIDKDELWNSLGIVRSPLLINALALLGSRIRPPIIQYAQAGDYYSRAKMLFYTDQEKNPITCLQSIILFYWWAPRGPSTVHKDAAWWWTGLAIKYAQQMGLHREPKNTQDVGGELMQGLRRRIWWTLFARERLTGICQGRPCTIDPEDCNVREPSLGDFPAPGDGRADIFINWVRLCAISGRVGKYLSRNTESPSFPGNLAQELIEWVHSLPEHLSLPINMDRTLKFNRDVHNLHLPYLTTVTIMHMNRSSQPSSQTVPEAYTAAVLAASCVARIFKDYLARGGICFLGAISCWYVGVAILALIHTQRIERLAQSGAEDIRTLRLALNELASMWPSASVFVKGFERLRLFDNPADGFGLDGSNGRSQNTVSSISSPLLSDFNRANGIDWASYFPYVTTQTSALAGILLAEHQKELWADISWLGDPTIHLQNLFDEYDMFSGFTDTT